MTPEERLEGLLAAAKTALGALKAWNALSSHEGKARRLHLQNAEDAPEVKALRDAIRKAEVGE
jgi:hypothetical protein